VSALLVAVPGFSGPLELLLSLIQKRRLDVTSVSLAEVADQYLEQVLALEGELEALSEFLLLASQLLLIKSRELLPGTAAAEPEGDPAEELRRRLAEYQLLQHAADWLSRREADELRSWPRGGDLPEADSPLPLAPISPSVLPRLLAARLRQRQTEPPAPGALRTTSRPTLQERAHVVFSALEGDTWLALDEVLGPDVPVAVATFLAVLALVRRGLVLVRQAESTAPLEVRRQPNAPAVLGDLGALD
jgi:segregation and condensation protein A